jgi:hypothetical protein
MCNALHYLGEKQLGSQLYKQSKMISNQAWPFQKFCAYMRTTNKALNKITFPKPSTVDILKDIECLHLVVVKGNDGKEDHCIAITKQWIFDSNFEKALPRTRPSLDQCCSSSDTMSLFVGPVMVAVFPKLLSG